MLILHIASIANEDVMNATNDDMLEVSHQDIIPVAEAPNMLIFDAITLHSVNDSGTYKTAYLSSQVKSVIR